MPNTNAFCFGDTLDVNTIYCLSLSETELLCNFAFEILLTLSETLTKCVCYRKKNCRVEFHSPNDEFLTWASNRLLAVLLLMTL